LRTAGTAAKFTLTPPGRALDDDRHRDEHGTFDDGSERAARHGRWRIDAAPPPAKYQSVCGAGTPVETWPAADS
jgi:hypothetical protein